MERAFVSNGYFKNRNRTSWIQSKDPLVEYKKESYNLFLELVNRIKFDSIKLLFSVQFNQEEAQNLENKANEENEKLLQSSVEMGASEDNLGEAEFKKFHAMLLVLAEVEKI